jgi:hypothetical protein
MNVTIKKIENLDEIYCRYDRQSTAQPCYVELDCRSGVLTASYNAEIGNAIPMDVYRRHIRQYSIPLLTPAAVNDLLESLHPLAQRVVDGYTSKWDGNNNIARFTDDASEADGKIASMCMEYEVDENTGVSEWDAGDWLSAVTYRRDSEGESCSWGAMQYAEIDGYGSEMIRIDAETTDDRLDEIKKNIEDVCDGNVVLHGINKYIDDIRQQCRENADD